jgi:predicted AlkP superfamily pyrophosphatase or phosphodiesterase
MQKRRRPLRLIATALLGLVALVVLAAAGGVWLTGGDYPPREVIPAVVAAPGPHRPLAGTPARSPAVRTVVVLLFDGLAPTLLEGRATPALDRLRREGAWTHNMVPPFPSISLISGFTISTGCWPEHHGIVSNRFFDPERGFYDHSRDADWMIGCEHLHQAAERQGVPTATLGWYGEVSTTRGKLARHVEYAATFDEYPSDAARAEQVVRLLALPPAERPQLILAYFKGPDGAAHFKGMSSPEVAAAVTETDRAVGVVLAAVERTGEAVLIVTTDHGMVPTGEIVNLEYLLRSHGVSARIAATGTSAFVYLDDPATRPAAIAALSGHDEYLDVILPEAQPEWSHLGTGPRTGDLIVSARPPYVIEDRGQLPWFFRWLAWTGPELIDARSSLHASHGYPPGTPGVEGVFYAWGDGIRPGRVERVDAIDIHPTVTHLLGIAPGEPVDGKVATAILAVEPS